MNQPARHLRRPEAAPRAPEQPRHLRVVDRGERTLAQRQRRRRAILLSSISGVLAVMFALVYLHVVLAQRQIELNRLSAQAASSQTQYQALRLKVAQLESPQQIISAAEGRLGMRQPASVTYVVSPPQATAAGTTGSSATPATTGAASSNRGTTAAPAGDADWPQVKAELAGNP